MMVQTCDTLAYVCIELLGMKSVERLRAGVNAKKVGVSTKLARGAC